MCGVLVKDREVDVHRPRSLATVDECSQWYNRVAVFS